MSSVREVTYQLLRDLGMTVIFGNPESAELPFLHDIPREDRSAWAWMCQCTLRNIDEARSFKGHGRFGSQAGRGADYQFVEFRLGATRTA